MTPKFLLLIFLIMTTTLARADFSSDSSSNIDENFEHWESCYNSTSPECTGCHQHGDQERGTEVVESEVRRACLPARNDSQVLFSDRLSTLQMSRRDALICECLETRPNAFERDPYRNTVVTPERLQTLRQKSELVLSKRYSSELNSRLENERLQNSYSAMSYINNGREATDLAAKYAFVGDDNNTTTQTNTSRQSTADAGLNAAETTALDTFKDAINGRAVSRSDLTGSALPANFCIPYRNFLTSKQFPVREGFYVGLSTLGATFNNSEWDYRKIMADLRSEIGTGDFEASTMGRGKAAQLYERAAFLHNNPIFRNIFNSSNNQAKADLFGLIRNMPQPNCSSGVCIRSAEWTAQMEEYRRKMAGFLNQEDVILANREGSEISSRLAYQVTGEIARKTSQSSALLIESEELSNPVEWKGFCTLRSQFTSDQQLAFIRNVEENDFGNRDVRNVADDFEFEALNDLACNQERRNPQTGRKEKFSQFLRRECATITPRCSLENRGRLVGEYLLQYSDALGSPDEAEVALLIPILTGQVSGPQSISQSDIENFNRVNRDPVLSRSRVQFSSPEYAGLTAPARNATASGNTQIQAATRSPASTSSSAAGPSQFLSDGSQSGFLAQQSSGFVPVQPIASGAQATQSAEAAKTAFLQNDPGAQRIQNEMESLNRMISDSSGTSRTSNELRSLTSRLEELEKSLDDKVAENERLRQEREDDEEDDQDESSESFQRIANRQSPRESRGGTASALTSGAGSQGGSTSGSSSFNAPVSSGGASLLPSSGNSRAAPVRSSANTTLLNTKYGVQEGSSQGAIVVSSSSDDVQTLRSQSEQNIVVVPVSPGDFDLIVGNNEDALNRYVGDPSKYSDGVARLNLNGGSGRSMEIFVVKTPTEFKIVRGQLPGRAIASETLEVIAEPTRTVTLPRLRDQLLLGQ